MPISDGADSRADIERKVDGATGAGRGTSWYVYSGAPGNGKGNNWTNATATIEGAVDLASAYDTIHVGQLHTEVMVAGSVDLDKAGLRVIGYGIGTGMPKLDFDTSISTSAFSIGAANVLVENILFNANADMVSKAIDIEATGDGSVIRKCEFISETAGTDEFHTTIYVTTAADNVTVEDCKINMQAGGSLIGIYFGTVESITLTDNIVLGDYATACLNNVGASDELFDLRNIYYNGNLDGDSGINAVAAISLANSTSGLIADAKIYSGGGNAVAMRTGDDVTFSNNWIQHTDGDDTTGGLEALSAAVTVSAAAD
ncbi:hypothetical protein KAR91_50805 [Candidatus Pacearchaeota archaeon]|nr:hypothetical protein [Candidatus Pacearchaeota archaeon]